MDDDERTYSLSLDSLLDIVDETTEQCILGRKWLERYVKDSPESDYIISLLCDMHSVNYKLFLEIERMLEDPSTFRSEEYPEKEQVLLTSDDAVIIEKLMISRYYVNDELNRLYISTSLN